MIELSTYLWTVGFLITIVCLFLAHYLREPRIKATTSELKKQNNTLITEKAESQQIILNLTKKIDDQQKTITEQETKISIPSKYTFDPIMGFLISVVDSKPYCTACLLKLEEVPLDTKNAPAICPKCGTKYPLQARFISVHPTTNPFRNI
jgi:hypothetical protein